MLVVTFTLCVDVWQASGCAHGYAVPVGSGCGHTFVLFEGNGCGCQCGFPYHVPTKNVLVAIYTHRISRHGATKVTPFELMYGQEAVLPVEVNLDAYRLARQNDMFVVMYHER